MTLCSESRQQLEENLERWRFALEIRGMSVSCSKTEFDLLWQPLKRENPNGKDVNFSAQ